MKDNYFHKNWTEIIPSEVIASSIKNMKPCFIYNYKHNKYNAQKIEIDGYIFDSIAEGYRYGELKLLQKQGYIKELQIHPKFELLGKFKYKGKTIQPIYYEADFMYEEGDKMVVEDVKGVLTKEYKLKKKLFLSKYGDIYDFCEI